MHCHNALGQWAADLFNALPHCLGVVGSGNPAMHCYNARGQRVVDLLQCTATLRGGSGEWNSCNAVHDCLRAGGNGIVALHHLTMWGEWALQLLQCIATPCAGNSCYAPPHYLGAVGSGLVQCTALLLGGSG